MFKARDYTLRYQSNSDVEVIPANQHAIDTKPLTNLPILTILVWNIFKQKRAECISILEKYADEAVLILLQEAQNKAALLSFINKYHKIADFVPAYSFNEMYAGVMTISDNLPISTISFKEKEPLIRIPKSALITIYPTSNYEQQLLVANIHSINFSLGIKIYHQQILSILIQVEKHQGPVILAGDFNSWSKQRLDLLYKLIDKIGLKAVEFPVDNRKTFMGRPLDYVFYRGLNLDSAEIISTHTSDHNPLLVRFS